MKYAKMEPRARDLLRLGDLEGAKRLAEDAISRIRGNEDKVQFLNLHFVLAEIEATQGRVEEALSHLESLVPLAETDAARALLSMYRGCYLGSLGRYGQSWELLAEAEVMACRAGLPEIEAETYLRQGVVFFLQKDYIASHDRFRAALNISEHLGGWYLRGSALWGMGKNLMIEGHYEEAMLWLQESLRIFEAAGARLSVALVWSELGVCRMGVGQDEDAMMLFRKAEVVNRDAGFVHNYQVVLANIGNVYLHRCDYFTALSYYQRAVSLAREIKDPVSVKKWSYNINLAYARIKATVDQLRHRSE